MRVSTNMVYDQNTFNVVDGQSKLMDSADQMSSGLRVRKPSDDPLSAARAVVVSQAEAQNNQYKVARTFASNGMSLEETVLKNATNTIQNIQTTLIYAGNGSLSDADRGIIAVQLKGLKEELFNLANSTDSNGRYIFAGFVSDKAPFEMDANGKVTYVGGADPLQQEVDAARLMTVHHTGDKVFMTLTTSAKPEPGDPTVYPPYPVDITNPNPPPTTILAPFDPAQPPGPPTHGTTVVLSETNIFNSIDFISEALAISQPADIYGNPTRIPRPNDLDKAQALLDKANRGLHNSLDNVLTIRAELGTQLKELDSLDRMGALKTLSNVSQENDLVNVDIYESASDYFKQKIALEASMSVFNGMKGMSLFELFR